MTHTIQEPDDEPTELYQLGIRWPDDSVVWGEPVPRAFDAKAGGWYESELDEVRAQYIHNLERAHAPIPTKFPAFVYRMVEIRYGAIEELSE